MVIGGTTKVEGEVFDLTNENGVCETTTPFERWGAVGAVLGKDIVVCGGKSKIGGRHHTCTVIHQSNNATEVSMLERRYGASSVAINDTALWIVGRFLKICINKRHFFSMNLIFQGETMVHMICLVQSSFLQLQLEP